MHQRGLAARPERTGITVWRLIAHHKQPAAALAWFRSANRIAIGWSNIGDLRQPCLATPAKISAAIRDRYPELKNAPSGGICLHAFREEIKPGDWVIVGDGDRRRAVMEVTGDYTFTPSPEPDPIFDYQNQRAATEIKRCPDALWQDAGGGAEAGFSPRWTLIRCRNPIPPLARSA